MPLKATLKATNQSLLKIIVGMELNQAGRLSLGSEFFEFENRIDQPPMQWRTHIVASRGLHPTPRVWIRHCTNVTRINKTEGRLTKLLARVEYY